MTSNPDLAAAYRKGLNKVHPRVKWVTHFVDRLVQREVPEKEFLPVLFTALKNHLLEIIFDSVRQDYSTKIQCNGHVVVAKFCEDTQDLLILTVYPGLGGRAYS